MLLIHTLVNTNQPQSEVVIINDINKVPAFYNEFVNYIVRNDNLLQTRNQIKHWIQEHIEKWEWDQMYIITINKFEILLTEDTLLINDIIAGNNWQVQIIDTDIMDETRFYLD